MNDTSVIGKDEDTFDTTAAEEKAGFSVQAIDYPETYELPRLGDKSGVRHERAVALVIDDANRIRRRKVGDGYVHEALTETGWAIQETFESLDEVVRHPVYVSWRRANVRDELEVCEEQAGEGSSDHD